MNPQRPFPSPILPAAWNWWIDELLPSTVKKLYSPRESWKDKPFTPDDARFFGKGIVELSELFTDDRPDQMPAYFQHPKFRSSYLLYFLPLQAAKFLTLYQAHSAAVDAAIASAHKRGAPLRVVDLGAGPGTASIALLLYLLGRKADPKHPQLPEIEITLVDTERHILEDGLEIIRLISSQFPKLRGRVNARYVLGPWWKQKELSAQENSLILFGHVLNEGIPKKFSLTEVLEPWIASTLGGGVLIVEPAAKAPSQLLSRIRDEIAPEHRLWGPCLHAEACPLAAGRDWCHLSVPAELKGKWFLKFSHALGSERHWLKFSYLWFAAPDSQPPKVDPNLRRVVSDRIAQPDRSLATVLLCEPEKVRRIPVNARDKVGRGDVIRWPAGPLSETSGIKGRQKRK